MMDKKRMEKNNEISWYDKAKYCFIGAIGIVTIWYIVTRPHRNQIEIEKWKKGCSKFYAIYK
jgi:hypothetical protein